MPKTKVHSGRDVRHRLYEQQSVLKKLILDSKTTEARELAIKVGKQASDFGVYDVAITCYEFMTKYYQVISPSKFHAKKYSTKLNEFEEMEKATKKVRRFYLDLYQFCDRNRSFRDQVKKASREFVATADKFEANHNHGPMFYHRYYLLKCLDRTLHYDYPGLLEIAEQAYDYFTDTFLSFNISRVYFLLYIADSYIGLKMWDEVDHYLNIAAGIDIPKETAWNNLMITQARMSLVQGEDAQEYLNAINTGFIDQLKSKTLLLAYNDLMNGQPVNEWSNLLDYQDDTTGLGIALNVARLWSSRLSGDVADDIDRMNQFKHRHLKDDPRSVLMINSLIYQRDLRDEMSRYVWRPDVEIIPWETILERISVQLV